MDPTAQKVVAQLLLFVLVWGVSGSVNTDDFARQVSNSPHSSLWACCAVRFSYLFRSFPVVSITCFRHTLSVPQQDWHFGWPRLPVSFAPVHGVLRGQGKHTPEPCLQADDEAVMERIEDEDVARERRRVLSDQANNDVLTIKELVKVATKSFSFNS